MSGAKWRAALAWLVPGGLLAWLAYERRGEIMSGIGYAVRSAYAGNVGGRRAVPVDQIVIHTTEATKESALAWFAMPHGASGPTSAHYVVGADGSVTLAVPEDRIAWHAASRAVNARSIGIECEGRAADFATWTPALLSALVGLVADVAARHRIPVVRGAWTGPGILGHSEIPAAAAAGKVDPGPHFPWAWFLASVAARGRGVA